jgi:hypothetical protein
MSWQLFTMIIMGGAARLSTSNTTVATKAGDFVVGVSVYEPCSARKWATIAFACPWPKP